MYNKNIEYLSGDSNFDLSPELPFTKKSCDFLGDLSKQLDNSKYLKEYPQLKGKISEIRTCVLFQKPKSTFKPDFVGKVLIENDWLILPTEPFEEIRVDDLRKKHNK